MENEFEIFADYFASVPDMFGDSLDMSESMTVTLEVFDMEKEVAEINKQATIVAANMFLALMSLFFWHHHGYTLKPDGWYKSGRYQFSLEDGLRIMENGEVPEELF